MEEVNKKKTLLAIRTEVRGVLKEQIECLKPMEEESDIRFGFSNLRPQCGGKDQEVGLGSERQGRQ